MKSIEKFSGPPPVFLLCMSGQAKSNENRCVKLFFNGIAENQITPGSGHAPGGLVGLRGWWGAAKGEVQSNQGCTGSDMAAQSKGGPWRRHVSSPDTVTALLARH
jgi:hypothetical protein